MTSGSFRPFDCSMKIEAILTSLTCSVIDDSTDFHETIALYDQKFSIV